MWLFHALVGGPLSRRGEITFFSFASVLGFIFSGQEGPAGSCASGLEGQGPRVRAWRHLSVDESVCTYYRLGHLKEPRKATTTAMRFLFHDSSVLKNRVRKTIGLNFQKFVRVFEGGKCWHPLGRDYFGSKSFWFSFWSLQLCP